MNLDSSAFSTKESSYIAMVRGLQPCVWSGPKWLCDPHSGHHLHEGIHYKMVTWFARGTSYIVHTPRLPSVHVGQNTCSLASRCRFAIYYCICSYYQYSTIKGPVMLHPTLNSVELLHKNWLSFGNNKRLMFRVWGKLPIVLGEFI